MSRESSQQKLTRIRPPRVHITYDVEVGGAMESKELPMVIGVVADLSAQGRNADARQQQRSFVDIDRDNFNEVLASSAPELNMMVNNRLTPDAGQLNVSLRFKSLSDFEPDALVGQIEPLKKLLQVRQQLNDLRNRIISNHRLEEVLDVVMRDPQKVLQLGYTEIHANHAKDEGR